MATLQDLGNWIRNTISQPHTVTQPTPQPSFMQRVQQVIGNFNKPITAPGIGARAPINIPQMTTQAASNIGQNLGVLKQNLDLLRTSPQFRIQAPQIIANQAQSAVNQVYGSNPISRNIVLPLTNAVMPLFNAQIKGATALVPGGNVNGLQRAGDIVGGLGATALPATSLGFGAFQAATGVLGRQNPLNTPNTTQAMGKPLSPKRPTTSPPPQSWKAFSQDYNSGVDQGAKFAGLGIWLNPATESLSQGAGKALFKITNNPLVGSLGRIGTQATLGGLQFGGISATAPNLTSEQRKSAFKSGFINGFLFSGITGTVGELIKGKIGRAIENGDYQNAQGLINKLPDNNPAKPLLQSRINKIVQSETPQTQQADLSLFGGQKSQKEINKLVDAFTYRDKYGKLQTDLQNPNNPISDLNNADYNRVMTEIGRRNNASSVDSMPPRPNPEYGASIEPGMQEAQSSIPIPQSVGKAPSQKDIQDALSSGNITAQEAQALGYTNDPVSKVINALSGAKSLRNQQESIYSQVRSQKAGEIANIGSNVPGEKGFYSQLSALKGEMPKVQFESIRNQIDQPTVDALFNQIETSDLRPFEKITAKQGLANLLGAQGGVVPTNSQLDLLNQVFPPEFTQAVLDKRSVMEKLWQGTSATLSLPRSFLATADMSAPLRQGLLLATSHPIEFAKSFGSMVRFFFDKNYYNQYVASLKDMPNYDIMKESNLALTAESSMDLTKNEEAFMSNITNNIPIMSNSNRAYTGFLTKLRVDTFNTLWNNMQRDGTATADNASALAHFINTSTGRGDLPSVLARTAPLLSDALFSPRLLASRIEVLNPYYYYKLPQPVRVEALKALFTTAASAITVLTLAKRAGADVSTNMTSADFGKIKVGNTRYDILGGFQQPIRLLAQIYAGKITSTTTGRDITLEPGYGKLTRLDILSRFFQSKESPIVSLIADAARGENQIGQKFSPGSAIISRMVPLVWQDMYDAAKEVGSPWAGIAMGIPEVFGVGMQTYGRQVGTLQQTPTGKPSIKMVNVTGLPEDAWSRITGKPAIPNQINDQGLVAAYQQKQKNTLDKQQAQQQAQSGNMNAVGNYLPLKLPDGSIKIIDTSFQPTPPKLTGSTELDKKAISAYKGQLTQKANDIFDLYQSGKITASDAERQLEQLKNLASTYSPPKTKKAPKVSVRRVSLPRGSTSGRISNIRVRALPKIKLAKAPVLKAIKSKQLKIAKMNLTPPKIKTNITIKA